MACAFGNLAALVFVVRPGERCTFIYRGHGDIGHGDMPVIRVSIFDYFFEFSSKQDVWFETFPQETFVFDILLSENNKNLRNN